MHKAIRQFDAAFIFAVVAKSHNRLSAPRSAMLLGGCHIQSPFFKPGFCRLGLDFVLTCASARHCVAMRFELVKHALDAWHNDAATRNDAALDVLQRRY